MSEGSGWYIEVMEVDSLWSGSPPEPRALYHPICPIRAASTLCLLEDRPVSWLYGRNEGARNV